MSRAFREALIREDRMISRFRPRIRDESIIITAIISQTMYRSEKDVSIEVTQFVESFPTSPHSRGLDDFETPTSYQA